MTIRIAIIGGGPGGLLTARLLAQRLDAPHECVIYEASDRLGGKIRTTEFAKAPGCPLEMGVAELYASAPGYPDPLRKLITQDLGLPIAPMTGNAVILGDHLIRNEEDLYEFGPDAGDTMRVFRESAMKLLSSVAYQSREAPFAANHPLAVQTYRDLMDDLHPVARAYLTAYTHSDLATEPHRTNAVYGLQNYLMNFPAYLSLYTIVGGIEQLPQALARECKAEIRLNHRVGRVEADGDSYRVYATHAGLVTKDEFDFVVCCLPQGWIPAIEWADDLAEPVHDMFTRYDNLASYLRVTCLFLNPFWEDYVGKVNWWMSSAFGGCCCYAENTRIPGCTWGILGWLIGGDPAVLMSNYDDDTLAQMAMDSLPTSLVPMAFQQYQEVFVQRYIGEVSGEPGCAWLRSQDGEINCPDPRHPGLLFCGDWQYDGTLNGVLESAGDCSKAIVNNQGRTIHARNT